MPRGRHVTARSCAVQVLGRVVTLDAEGRFDCDDETWFRLLLGLRGWEADPVETEAVKPEVVDSSAEVLPIPKRRRKN